MHVSFPKGYTVWEGVFHFIRVRVGVMEVVVWPGEVIRPELRLIFTSSKVVLVGKFNYIFGIDGLEEFGHRISPLDP